MRLGSDRPSPVIVARHGQTDWNLEGRYQGHADPPLNAAGRAQAGELAASLGAPDLGAVLSSDLVRAADTAAVVASSRGLAVVTDPGFREIDLGAWEGLTPADAEARFPAEFRAWTEGRDVARGGGETAALAAARFVAALDRHLGAAAAPVLVVAHGMVLRAALAALADAGRIHLDGPAPHLANGAWLALDVAPA